MSKEYYQAIYKIITAGHRITDQVGQELKEFGITEPQFNVMRILKGAKGKPITVQQILENMVQRSSNVTRIIDKLIAKGFVERRECPTNRRRMDITITEAGVAYLNKLNKKVDALHQPLINNLTSKELKTFNNLITKLTTRND